jgi:hypothetical protein
MGYTHNYFEYEIPIHYAELHACPLSGAFPACQYTQHHRDKFVEECKQYRIEGFLEEVGVFARKVANPEKAMPPSHNPKASVGWDT